MSLRSEHATLSRCMSEASLPWFSASSSLSLSTSHALPPPLQHFHVPYSIPSPHAPTMLDPFWQHYLLSGCLSLAWLRNTHARQARKKAKHGVNSADFPHEDHDPEGLRPLSSHQFLFNSSGLHVCEASALAIRCG